MTLRYGYLMAEKHREIRVLIIGSYSKYDIYHFMAIKSGGTLSREETEVMINKSQFDTLYGLTENTRLRKMRYFIPYGKYIAELDVYSDQLSGLHTVEVEFDTIQKKQKFYNSVLV